MTPTDARIRAHFLADGVYRTVCAIELGQRGVMDADEFKESLLKLELAKIYANLATG